MVEVEEWLDESGLGLELENGVWLARHITHQPFRPACRLFEGQAVGKLARSEPNEAVGGVGGQVRIELLQAVLDVGVDGDSGPVEIALEHAVGALQGAVEDWA